MARCQGCKKKIQKEHKRFGIPEHSEKYGKEIYRYYHVRCCPSRLQEMIPNAEGQLAEQKQLLRDKDQIVKERQSLYDELKRLRMLFANRLEVSFFLVFNNQVLKELVVNMPTTHSELLSIHGIGEQKANSFGGPILSIIRQYKNQMKRVLSDKKTKIRQGREKDPSAVVEVIVLDGAEDDDDDEIVMRQTLTCEQLVQQKFEHAARNGYIISVD
jgi:ribonuclease D